jgi:ADP-ribose pyrophosphatase YjhB (NUDIX family)
MLADMGGLVGAFFFGAMCGLLWGYLHVVVARKDGLFRSGQPERSPRLGVAVLVSDEQGRLLLGRRGKQPNYGKWVIPGGGVKFGEGITETALREIKEETGLTIDPVPGRPRVVEIFDESGNEHRIIMFWEARPVDDATIKPASDLLDARFFRKEELAELDISPVVKPVLCEFGWCDA